MQKKRFIFDLDGTILNTWQDLANAMNVALAKEGLPVFLPENYRLWVGSGALRLAEYLLAVEVPRALGIEAKQFQCQIRPEDLVKHFMEAYGQLMYQNSRPYPQMLDFLQQLQDEGQDLAVLTNKPEVFARPLVEHFFPGVFANVIGMQPGLKPKPDLDLPTRLWAATDPPKRDYPCVMIGDSEADVRMGKRLACPSIAVTWGYRAENVLLAEDPDFLVHDINELARTCFDLLK